MVIVLAFLELNPRLNIKYGFNPDGIKRKINSIGQAGQAKIDIFQRSHLGALRKVSCFMSQEGMD